MNFRFRKMLENSRVTAQLAASLEGLSSMELDSWYSYIFVTGVSGIGRHPGFLKQLFGN
jgi:hypothetical protein